MVSSIASSSSYDYLNYVSTKNKESTSSTGNYGYIQGALSYDKNTLVATGDIVDIVDDVRCFKSKENMYNYCAGEGINSLEDFSKALDATKGVDTTHVDYQAEYEKYIQDRGCDNQEELEALNSVSVKGGFIYSKSDLITRAKWAMAQTSVDVELATRTNNDAETGMSLDSELANNILSNASVSNLANYVNNCNNSQSNSFKVQVSNLQSFFSSVSKQDNISSELKNGISGYSQKLVSSVDEITAYTIKSEKYLCRNSDILSSEKYRASLISKYQS